jgi:rubrerythrin
MINEQTATTQALNQAMQMEIDGKKYYLTQSLGSLSTMGKKLFLQLSIEEDQHLKLFENIFKSISTRKGWPIVDIIPHKDGFKTVFAIETGNNEITFEEMDAVLTAMKMENKTRDFYLSHSNKATYPAEKEFYADLAQQERIHHNLLLDYYEYMQDPAQYFSVKEKHSLDGG